MWQKLPCVLIVLVLVIAGCQAKPSPAATAVPSLTPGAAYPGVTDTPADAYPAATRLSGSVTAFVIDRPVRAGATAVTGRGPAGVVVSILNVTLFGKELGSATIGSDNRFSASVAPLEPNVRLGLFLKDVGSSGKQPDDFNADGYKGPGALMVPQVGYFQDTVLVQP